MVTVELEKIVKDNKSNNQQDRYIASLKRFKKLIDKGVVQERKNQLLADTSKSEIQRILIEKHPYGCFSHSNRLDVQSTE